MAVIGHVDLHIRDFEPVQSVLSAGAMLADAVEVHLSPYTRESLIGPEAAMADALTRYRAAVTAAAEAVKSESEAP